MAGAAAQSAAPQQGVKWQELNGGLQREDAGWKQGSGAGGGLIWQDLIGVLQREDAATDAEKVEGG